MIKHAAYVYRNADPDEGGGGFADAADTSTVDASLNISTAAPDTGAAPADGAKPANMLEAMFGKPDAAQDQSPEAVAQRARDERGRFAQKQAEAGLKPGEQPLKQPVKQPGAVDPNAMPEGLTPKAQVRFQELANTNKELTARVQEFEPIVQSARELQATFQEHGVKREQFTQAMEVVGLMNRGDLAGAQRVLEQQLRLISLHTGKPVGAVDTLADHPDLRERVDALQLTEADAIELARNRMVNQSRQNQARQQEEAQDRQQQSEQATKSGQIAVDRFCKARMADDLDYTRIEPLLLKQIQAGLLRGVPPSQWSNIVEKTYGLIKETAGMTRSAGQSTQVLRPTGGESPIAKPRSMHEAMWGNKAPA